VGAEEGEEGSGGNFWSHLIPMVSRMESSEASGLTNFCEFLVRERKKKMVLPFF
jgi:hypothetical protein